MSNRGVIVEPERRVQIALRLHGVAQIIQGEGISRVEFQGVAQDVFGLQASSLLQQRHGLEIAAVHAQLQVAIRLGDLT